MFLIIPTAVAELSMLRPLLLTCCCSDASSVLFATLLTKISVMASGAEDDSWRKALDLLCIGTLQKHIWLAHLHQLQLISAGPQATVHLIAGG